MKKNINKIISNKIVIGVFGLVIGVALGCSIVTKEPSKNNDIEKENARIYEALRIANSDISEKNKKIKELENRLTQDKSQEVVKEETSEVTDNVEKSEPVMHTSTESDGYQYKNDVIKSNINSMISDKTIENVKITNVNVNENLSSDGCVVLINLTWDVKNNENTTKEMLKLYSNEIARSIYSDISNNSEIAIMWKAEYTGLDLKYNYIVKDGNVYEQ